MFARASLLPLLALVPFAFVMSACPPGDDVGEGEGEGEVAEGEGEGEGEGEAPPAPCPDGQLLCGTLCVDPLTSNSNCGASGECLADDEKGVACEAGFVCDGTGTCAPSCAAPFTACGEGDAAACTNVDEDEANCGACGAPCAAGESCTDGTCCTTGLLGCDGACVNAASDTANCGGCGIACAEGAACKDAACLCPAGAPDVCGGACVDTNTNVNACGACDTQCATGELCVAGACLSLDDVGEWSIAAIDVGACTIAEHESVTGDDRGGIAVTATHILYTGDTSTAAFDIADPTVSVAFGFQVEGLFSDLRTGKLYTLALDGAPFRSFDGGVVNELLELDPQTGAPIGAPIALAAEITGLDTGVSGVFAGLGRVAVAPSTQGGPLFIIDIASGDVTTSTMPSLDDVVPCETWAVWGVLETIEGDDWITTAGFGRINRARIADGERRVVQSFENLSDLCSFSVSLFTGRWAFHHEGQSELGAFGEAVGSCAAAFCFDGACACPAFAPTTCEGACVDTSSDPRNCGGCGDACALGEECIGGACACPAFAPDVCGEGDLARCVNTDFDVANCGGCDNACPLRGEECVDGACACPAFASDICPDPAVPGADACVNTDFDTFNCGECGEVCDRFGPCELGVCVPLDFTCGNNQVELGEDCDDGNTADGDACPAACLFDRCGSANNICNDGNPCTADVCADPATGLCEFTALDDGATCEFDGTPDTVDTCVEATCTQGPAPRPDPALIILDPFVLNDPAFSFKAMHDRLAGDGAGTPGDGAALFEQWASTFQGTLTLNGFDAPERPGFNAFVASLPRTPEGAIDLDAAGFRASAFVNRIDILRAGDCGESRVVYTKETGVVDRGDRMTIIFEFLVPDIGDGCVSAQQRWTALRGLEGDALRTAAVELMEDNSQPQSLHQMRTNEFVNAPFWELREFHLVVASGGTPASMTPFPVADTPPFELQDDPSFLDFVEENAQRFNAGARERDILPLTLLAPASRADGTRLSIGPLVPSIPGLEANVNVMMCSGCHFTETGTFFVHVRERTADEPSRLSAFMLSELDFRSAVVDEILAP